MSEPELVKNIIDNSAKGYSLNNKLYFDKHSKRIRPTGYGHNPDSGLSMSAEDTKFSATGGIR
ncbi:MAG: hypothetical protein A2Y10_20255 [Planctomycetes bacterium GWF2_41_51]|nr:MAG: hypothetical protein A2Y10_20255 [Planctomycetes bacterium GWF2_41_51]HBG25752.1 hypothetical protein [Phycisphaerales bacterium]